MKSLLKFLIVGLLLLGLAYFIYPIITEEIKSSGDSAIFIEMEKLKPDWVEQRKSEQLAAAQNYKVFHDFGFENKIDESGITFKHFMNPDGGITHKPVHYDHGNGLCVADIDNDGLEDIYFVSQVGKGSLFKNLGNGKFKDITSNSGLEITDTKSCTSASFADIDNDGDPDLFVSVIRDGNFLFENKGDGKFENISESSKTDYHAHSSGVIFFDYDKDGLLDLYVNNVGVYTSTETKTFQVNNKSYSYYVGLQDGFAGHLKSERYEKSVLYKNLGDNTFQNVTKEVGINNEGWTGDAAVIDGNDDGYPDLYITNMQGNDEYYENINGKIFKRKSRAVFPKTSWGAMGIEVFDFDNDGQQDIYITDMHSDMGSNSALGIDKEKIKRNVFPKEYLQSDGNNIAGNTFFRKTGKNNYEEISENINAENYWPWGLSAGDLNADGFEDVFVCKSMNYPFRYTENLILLNENGQKFLDSEYLLGIEPRKDGKFAKPWFELDCDGKHKDHKHCHKKSGQQIIYSSLGTRSSVVFDLDKDGDLDIITNEYNDSPMVLMSNLSDKRPINFIEVTLEGTTSNRAGIGTSVKVKTNNNAYTKVNDGKSGYLSQSQLPLYFGLGEEKKVESISIVWPSGKTQNIDGSEIVMNQRNLIKENQ